MNVTEKQKLNILDKILNDLYERESMLNDEVRKVQETYYKYKKERQKDLDAAVNKVRKVTKEKNILHDIKTDVYMIHKIKSQLS